MFFYKKVIVVGSGRLPKNCINTLLQFNLELTCIEPVKTQFPVLFEFCKLKKINYKQILDKNQLDNYFLSIADNTLIISAYNIHIFSSKVLLNSYLLVVNFHNSLLPKHRGRNSPSWTIFEMDKIAGISWHLITDQIDKGNLIKQISFKMPDNITALNLSQLCLDTGSKCFSEIVVSLLNNDFISNEMKGSKQDIVHYSKEIPNNGLFDVNWSIKKGFAFLRSLDYYVYPIFPKPIILISETKYNIVYYKYFKIDDPLNEHDFNEHENYLLLNNKDECLKLYLKKNEE